MLPSEQFELAIYKWIKAVGVARVANIENFYKMAGSNGEYALVVERLKDLHNHGYIRLLKISGNYSVPFEKFVPIEGENAFFGGGFTVEVAPGGRKFFEALEAREEQKRQQKEQIATLSSDGVPSDNPLAVKAALQPKTTDSETKQWDVFISHASEDKEFVARPLAVNLRNNGLRVWYDEFTLMLGDSLRASIDRGLAQSRFGVVILSQYFFGKHWREKELNGLAAIEVGGRKVILPIWHRVTRVEVAQYSPTLADRKAIATSEGPDRVIEEILKVVKPDRGDTTIYGETHDLHVGTRVHVRKPVPGLTREQWPFDAEIYVIRKTNDQTKTAIATPVLPPLNGPTPTVEGPMTGPHSPFKRANIPS